MFTVRWQELRDKAGGGVTTDGRVFVGTKAELNRLEALRRVMAERSYRTLVKGPSPCVCSRIYFIRRKMFLLPLILLLSKTACTSLPKAYP